MHLIRSVTVMLWGLLGANRSQQEFYKSFGSNYTYIYMHNTGAKTYIASSCVTSSDTDVSSIDVAGSPSTCALTLVPDRHVQLVQYTLIRLI